MQQTNRSHQGLLITLRGMQKAAVGFMLQICTIPYTKQYISYTARNKQMKISKMPKLKTSYFQNTW